MLKRRFGFTLLEVLLALAIMVVGSLLITSSWSGNFSRVRKANLYNNVAILLESKMVEMEAKYAGKKFDEMKEEGGGFGDAFPEYRWEFKPKELEMPDMTAAVTAQTKTTVKDEFLQVIQLLQEAIAKSVTEATVTVYVTAGKKEIPFSLTTYIVNYNSAGTPGGVAPETGSGESSDTGETTTGGSN